MAHHRTLFAGFTDYTGVSLEDIMSDLRQWNQMTNDTVTTLQQLKGQVLRQPSIFELPDEVIIYLDHCIELFQRYIYDFERLIREIPSGVLNSHIEILLQIYDSSRREDRTCREFRNDFIAHKLKDKNARPLLDKIYRKSRSAVSDFQDLSNLVPRLRTFLRNPSGSHERSVFELKPNLWGIGIDLRAALERIRRWWGK